MNAKIIANLNVESVNARTELQKGIGEELFHNKHVTTGGEGSFKTLSCVNIQTINSSNTFAQYIKIHNALLNDHSTATFIYGGAKAKEIVECKKK
jgi:hypothetical protein